MVTKPRRADGYDAEHLERVRAACLVVATKLGDLLDEIVIVGGLVPLLLVEQSTKNADERHVGTTDLDLGFALGLFNDKRYQELTERLRSADFEPDNNERGKPTHQRWRLDAGPTRVTVDFLIAPTCPEDQPGKLKHIDEEFAAIITRGLPLAFRDRENRLIEGLTPARSYAKRVIPVCGIGAFIVLKAFAFRNRSENKDAYDIFYVLRHFGDGLADVASKLKPLLDDPDVPVALGFLEEDFARHDSLGAGAVADFLGDPGSEDVRADVSGLVQALLQLCRG